MQSLFWDGKSSAPQWWHLNLEGTGIRPFLLPEHGVYHQPSQESHPGKSKIIFKLLFQNINSPLKSLLRRGSLNHMKKGDYAKIGSYYKSQFILHLSFHFYQYIMYCQAVLIRAEKVTGTSTKAVEQSSEAKGHQRGKLQSGVSLKLGNSYEQEHNALPYSK